MKKTKLWKRIAGWLLVFLLVLQLPVNAFAGEWVDNTPYSSEENFTDEQDISEESDSSGDQTDVEEASDSEDQIDIEEEIPTEDSFDVGEETDTSSDLDMEESGVSEFTSEDEFTDGSTALFSDGTDQSEDGTAKEEIQVTVSISKDGKFLNDKDGNPMAGRTVTLTGQSSYTMDDALKAAHDLYYPGGAEAGYDYHADDAGIFDGVIYRLWGYDKKNVPYINSSLNRNSANYGSALGRTVENGDEMHFFIQQKNGQDKLAFFTEEEQTVTEGQPIVLRLRQEDDAGRAYSNCEGASIYIDGKKQENIITDAEGKVTLPVLEAREKDFTSDNNLFNIQADILQTMARSESFIVIGKCADFVLRPYGNVINVFIEAPQNACIHTIMERTNVSEQRALQMYKKTNKYRSEYYNHYTYGGEWRDPMNYDLVLNSYKVGIDNCVKFISV